MNFVPKIWKQYGVWIQSTKENGELVWAGTGEMVDPNSREAVRNEITGLIAPELARQGIIPKQ